MEQSTPAVALAPTPAALPWGSGDFYTVIIAVVLFGSACVSHRRALGRRSDKSGLLIEFMGAALSCGPLLMILADPFVKNALHWNVDLLGVVMRETRVTLWFVAFIALIDTLSLLLRPRP